MEKDSKIYPVRNQKYIENYKFSYRVYRVLDANINRAKEGLRVCEDFTRFILNDRSLTAKFKSLRHKLSSLINNLEFDKDKLFELRASLSDVGRKLKGSSEFKRKDSRDIFFANIQRVKESLRVLEEFSKLVNKKASVGLKDIRYIIYDIEKNCASKIKSLFDS